jgi:hypothetical protein
MTLLSAHLICATATWIALVADGVTGLLTPKKFVRALRHDVVTFGLVRVLLWMAVCLTMWWAVWFAWMTEWLESRR